MAKPAGRHHFPCRGCGEAHTNPESSTICDTCGNAEYSIKLLNKAAADKAQRLEDEVKKADKLNIDLHITALLDDKAQLVSCAAELKEQCRTMFNVMYKGELMNKEKVWANLCLSLGIEA